MNNLILLSNQAGDLAFRLAEYTQQFDVLDQSLDACRAWRIRSRATDRWIRRRAMADAQTQKKSAMTAAERQKKRHKLLVAKTAGFDEICSSLQYINEESLQDLDALRNFYLSTKHICAVKSWQSEN